jgi:ABC-type branched-subunit amino acid transport system substrate-binding protein
MARLLASLVLVPTLLVGCPARAVRLNDVAGTTDDPEAERAFRTAQALVAEQRWPLARAEAEAFLIRFPEDPLVPDASLLLGRVALATGDVPRARELFARVRRGPDAALGEQAAFFDGLALARAGDARAALSALRPFAGRMVDRAEAALLYRTLADAARTTGDRVEALRWLDALHSVVEAEPARVEALTACQAVADGPLAPAEIERAIQTLPRDGVAWPLVVLRRAKDALDEGDFAAADRMHALLHEAVGGQDARVGSLSDTIADRRNVDARAIGAILPLSGRAREVGAEVLRGLLTASEPMQEGIAEGRRFRLVVRDDGGDPARAAAAVDDLVQTEHVIAILGPVEGASAEAAARRAQALGVPLLLLSPREGLTTAGPNVFRTYLTNGAEAAALAQDALAARGIRDVAIVYPDIPYGQALRAALTGQAASNGLRVVTEVRYPAGTRSFGELLAPLHTTTATAIVLPCPASDVRLLAPAIAAAGLWSAPVGGRAVGQPSGARPVQLVLTSVGIDPETLRVAGRYLQGALVSTAFVPGTAPDLESAYLARFERAPTVHAAFAHDAFQLVRRAVEAGAGSRAALRAALAGASAVGLATSMTGFGPDREPRAAVRLVRVDGAALVSP